VVFRVLRALLLLVRGWVLLGGLLFGMRLGLHVRLGLLVLLELRMRLGRLLRLQFGMRLFTLRLGLLRIVRIGLLDLRRRRLCDRRSRGWMRGGTGNAAPGWSATGNTAT
jgi:hypothetical protein